MPGVDISTSFARIEDIAKDYFSSGKKVIRNTPTGRAGTDNYCCSVDDVFDALREEGDYSMLSIALRFMDSLYPMDLFMFFDELCTIEGKLFQKYDLNYAVVSNAYTKHREKIQTNYIDFVISYHTEATQALFDLEKEYNLRQLQFLASRNKVLLDVLPQIGTKLSRAVYVDYVVDNNSDLRNP